MAANYYSQTNEEEENSIASSPNSSGPLSPKTPNNTSKSSSMVSTCFSTHVRTYNVHVCVHVIIIMYCVDFNTKDVQPVHVRALATFILIMNRIFEIIMIGLVNIHQF